MSLDRGPQVNSLCFMMFDLYEILKIWLLLQVLKPINITHCAFRMNQLA